MFFRPLRRSHLQAFTLIEVMISLLVLGLTSTAVYMALSSISFEEMFTRDRITAKNILTSRYEQIKQGMDNNPNAFYNMNTANFPAQGPWQTYSQPGYPANFFESRVVFLSGTEEAKTFSIAVRWTPENGQLKQVDHVFTVSRPADTLPGNIQGTVTNCTTSAPIVQAMVTIISQDDGTSRIAYTNSNGFYTFLVNTVRVLPTGDYAIQGSKANHGSYPPASSPSVIVNVQSSQDTTHDFCLEPNPTANLKFILQSSVAGETDQAFSGLVLRLLQNGSGPSLITPSMQQNYAAGGKTFTVGFPVGSTAQRCFTLVTGQLSGNLSSSPTNAPYYPFFYNQSVGSRTCSRSCAGETGWNLPSTMPYNYKGWSSAQVRDEVYTPGVGYTNVACANPWVGSSAAGVDRFCASPGQADQTFTITLDRIPTATLSGSVKRLDNTPIAGADVMVWWRFNGQSSNFFSTSYNKAPIITTTTDANGNYSLIVPAAQELFPNDQAWYLHIYARAYIQVPGCCEAQTPVQVEKDAVVGPATVGSTLNYDFALPDPPGAVVCGNLSGDIKDHLLQTLVPGSIIMLGANSQTTPTGSYAFSCPPGNTGYKLPALNYSYTIDKSSNYYQRNSVGNTFYKPTSTISVAENTGNTFDSTILARGYGTITGTVTYQSPQGSAPVPNIRVSFTPNSTVVSPSTSLHAFTDQNGVYTINNAHESWPPQASGVSLVSDTEFYLTPRNHTMMVNPAFADKNPNYATITQSNIVVERNQTNTYNFQLTLEGSGL